MAINLKRCKFLSYALGYIAQHPGCSKADIVGICANATRANRYMSINRLISEGLVEDRSTIKSRYSLFVKGN
jgi:hypothetical protein